MRTFIGIGADHVTDVYETVAGLLDKHQPDAITLEQMLSLLNEGEGTNYQLMDRRRELLESNPPYSVAIEGRQVRLSAEDLCLFSSDSPEKNAGIIFALNNGLPFYFVDWNDDFPDCIFRFENGRICKMELTGKTTYQNFPEATTHRGRPFVHTGKVNGRNRFTSDAINNIAAGYNSIAYIGGYFHFDSAREMPFALIALGYPGLSPGLELQSLVHAGHKIVYDVSNGTPKELQI